MLRDFGYWKAIGSLLDAYEKETERDVKIAILDALGWAISEGTVGYDPIPKEFYSSQDCLRAREKLIEVIKKEDDVELVKRAADALGYYYAYWEDGVEILENLSRELDANPSKSPELSKVVWGIASDVRTTKFG
ncbi:MAG: hypothetical protein QXH27_05520 [Candidatus Micrarchaeia archaeon]